MVLPKHSHTLMRLYVYRVGRDFIAPENLGRQLVPFLADDPVCCDGFEEVTNPAEADYYILPFFLELLTEHQKISGMWEFVSSLPYFKAREQDHVFFSNHDSSVPYITRSVWFRASVNRFDRDPFCYAIPHVVKDIAGGREPDLSKVRYHTSFVGYLGYCGERLPLLKSISAKKALVSFMDTVNSFHGLLDEQQRILRREKYLTSFENTLTVLCPRGDGENSIRFFETLSAGRIPVFVSDSALLPLENIIPYQECIMRIAEADVKNAGYMLYDWLASQDDGQLIHRCRTARAVWEKYFSPSGFGRLVLGVLNEHRLYKDKDTSWTREDSQASCLLARAAHEKIQANDLDEAENLMLRAIAHYPRNAVLYNDLGVVMFSKGKKTAAEQAFRKALGYDHRLVRAHVNLGLLLSGSNDKQGAMACFRRAAALAPNDRFIFKCIHELEQQ